MKQKYYILLIIYLCLPLLSQAQYFKETTLDYLINSHHGAYYDNKHWFNNAWAFQEGYLDDFIVAYDMTKNIDLLKEAVYLADYYLHFRADYRDQEDWKGNNTTSMVKTS